MADTDNTTTLTPTEQSENAKASQERFKMLAVEANIVRKHAVKGVIVDLLKILASQKKKEVEATYKEKRKDLRKDYKGNTDGAAYLKEFADQEANVIRDTVRETLAFVDDAIEALQEAAPVVTEFMEACLDNPRQTVLHGVRRVDFFGTFMGLMEAKRAVNASTEAVLAEWTPEQKKEEAKK